jgi:hypothetical protein
MFKVPRNKRLRDLYGSSNIVRVVISRKKLGWVRQGINTELWWGKPLGKCPLGRPRRSLGNNVKIRLRAVEMNGE